MTSVRPPNPALWEGGPLLSPPQTPQHHSPRVRSAGHPPSVSFFSFSFPAWTLRLAESMRCLALMMLCWMSLQPCLWPSSHSRAEIETAGGGGGGGVCVTAALSTPTPTSPRACPHHSRSPFSRPAAPGTSQNLFRMGEGRKTLELPQFCNPGSRGSGEGKELGERGQWEHGGSQLLWTPPHCPSPRPPPNRKPTHSSPEPRPTE